MELLARVRHQLSLSSERLMTTRALVNNLLVVKGRVGTRGTTPNAINVVSIIADRVLRALVRGVTNLAMQPRIAGVSTLRISDDRTSSKLHRISVNNNSSSRVTTKDAFSVVLKATSKEIAPN